MNSFSFQRQRILPKTIFLSAFLFILSSSACDFINPVCGDGVVDADNNEVCDDGNTLDGDGCDANCAVEAICGNGILEENEECDDGNDIDDDACDTNCLIFCQEPFFRIDAPSLQANDTTEFENISDGSCQLSANGGGGRDAMFLVVPEATGLLELTVTSDADLGIFVQTECANEKTEIACVDSEVGNGAVEVLVVSVTAGEAIFVLVGGFVESNTGPFTLELKVSVCGNETNEFGEECDDGNNVNNDRCNNACQLETVSELEPNDDGTPEVDSDDFDPTNANGPFVDDVVIRAAISPAGDDDVFEIRNASKIPQEVEIETFGRNGEGIRCNQGEDDTVLRIRNAAGDVLAENDDIADNGGGGSGVCSLVKITLKPKETVFVQVIEFQDDLEMPLYFLDVRFL